MAAAPPPPPYPPYDGVAAPAPAPARAAAAATPPAFPGDTPMPAQMIDYIEGLQAWAEANQKDARRDSIKFWSLKGPAIVVAGSSGLLATLHLPNTVSILFGLVGGVCVALDGIIRPGLLHKTHIRAVHDLLILADNIRSQWNISYLAGRKSGQDAAEILENAEKKKQEIARYLKAEESDTLHEEGKKSKR